MEFDVQITNTVSHYGWYEEVTLDNYTMINNMVVKSKRSTSGQGKITYITRYNTGQWKLTPAEIAKRENLMKVDTVLLLIAWRLSILWSEFPIYICHATKK